MKNDYSWVADKKREAMAAKLQRRGMPNMFPRTVAERYGVSYTGIGDDGRLDRSAPAGLDTSTNPPHIYHEGETRVATPEGAVYLNADVTSMADPGAMERMRAMEGSLPGFATGGGMLRGVPVSGMGGMPAAPQYKPADTPRAMGRGMLGMNAIGQPQQQQGNQEAAPAPMIRGWSGNPASMANSGLATIAQGAQPQPAQGPQGMAVNPLAGLRMGGNPQIPVQPQPAQLEGTLPGYASGGGQVQVIGDDGGVNQQYGGSGSNGTSPMGSQPASRSTGNAGAGGFISTARRRFGAATDFLRQSGAQATMNGNNATINPALAKRADQNNGLAVSGVTPIETVGNNATGNTVLSKERTPDNNNNTEGNIGNSWASKLFPGIKTAVENPTPQPTATRELTQTVLDNTASYVKNAIKGRAGQRAVIKQTPQELVTMLRGQGWSDDQIGAIFTRAGHSGLLSSIDWSSPQISSSNTTGNTGSPWWNRVVKQAISDNAADSGLDHESTGEPEDSDTEITTPAVDPYSEFADRTANLTDLSKRDPNLQRTLDPEAVARISDMRQEAASRQAYLQHQQAMNGTDANAAWAQSAMERAAQEEGINDFAAEYAKGQAERDWNRLYAEYKDAMESGNPEAIARYGAIYNYELFPGADIDFSTPIGAAVLERYNGTMATAMANAGTMSSTELAGFIKKMNPDLSDQTIGAIVLRAQMNEFDVIKNSLLNSPAFLEKYPNPDMRAAVFEGLWADYIGGTLTKDADGNWKFGADTGSAELSLAKDIVDGGVSFKNNASKLSDADYDYIASKTPEGTGTQTLVGYAGGTQMQEFLWFDVGRKTNAGYTVYPQIEDAYRDGSAVKIDGKLYYVKSVDRAGEYKQESLVQKGLGALNPYGGGGGHLLSGYTTYTLVDPKDGKTISFDTARQEV